ncbi:MAG TPA: glycosyltransferase family 39 protein [Bacteroidales bacterium]|nr:glycosyltransferase family 39 protein [Bacteroidales bacterium]HPS16822.1 glycosyltransferase family 39 protein [Bacteroidales bacterium]
MALIRTKKWIQENYIFFLIIICLFFVYDYNYIISKGPRSIHQWRQADCLSITQNYYAEGMHFFSPSIHWTGTEGDGKTVSEFPILYYFVAFLWKIFGKHEYIFRMINLFIAFMGLFYLFKLAKAILKNTFWATIIVLLLFSSPIFVYYANNFIINVPAFSLVIPGWYFFYKFYKESKNKYLYISFLFFFIAGLLKISTTISFISILIVFSIEFFRLGKFKKDKKIFDKPYIQIIPFLLVIGFLLLWYSYASHYNKLHHSGIFLQGILPIWGVEGAKIKPIFVSLYNELLPQFHNKFILHLIFLFFIALLISFKNVNKFLLLITICTFVAVISYIILFFQVFDVHDYYLIDLLIFPIAVLITFISFIKDNYLYLLNSKKIKVISLVVIGCSIYYCAINNRIKYKPNDNFVKTSFIVDKQQQDFYNWVAFNYKNTFQALETITPYLRSLGIQRTDKVISIPDESINISLYLMDQKGITDYSNLVSSKEKVQKIINSGIKYLIINDTNILQTRTYLSTYTKNEVGKYKNIYIYDLNEFNK